MGDRQKAKAKSTSISAIQPSVARSIDAALENWFRHAQRKLKFRETRDAYAITVSEFMLQQTTVATVEPYYDRFLKQFPTVESLAAATEDEVMQLWAGLGYYRRARQLREAAIEVVENFGGRFPQSVEELMALPGFGRYTAGAVLSAAFDLPAPILEANTIRVFARLAARQGLVGDAIYMRDLWAISESLVNKAASARVFNVAAMELGALICKPKPRCEFCPLQLDCRAFLAGVAEVIPIPRPKPEKVSVANACIAIRGPEDKYLVRRIPKGEWHGGMWEFPSQRVEEPVQTTEVAAEIARKLIGQVPRGMQPLTWLKYTVTRHSVTSHVFHCHADVEGQEIGVDGEEMMFATLSQISALPMGSAQKKLLKLLSEKAAENETT